jgi:hypothetical protein
MEISGVDSVQDSRVAGGMSNTSTVTALLVGVVKMVDRNLEARLSDLETDLIGDGSRVVVLTAVPDDEYTILNEPSDGDPISAYREPVIPYNLPPGYFSGGVSLLSPSKLEALWDEMPPEVQQEEYQKQQEQNEPIPPILADSEAVAEHSSPN